MPRAYKRFKPLATKSSWCTFKISWKLMQEWSFSEISDHENDSPSIKSFFRVTQNLFLASKNLTKLRINDFNFLEENPGKNGWDVNIHTKTRVNVHACQENLPSLVTSNWTSHMATQDSESYKILPTPWLQTMKSPHKLDHDIWVKKMID